MEKYIKVSENSLKQFVFSYFVIIGFIILNCYELNITFEDCMLISSSFSIAFVLTVYFVLRIFYILPEQVEEKTESCQSEPKIDYYAEVLKYYKPFGVKPEVKDRNNIYDVSEMD